MNTKEEFLSRFKYLMDNGVHLLATLVDDERRLQFTEIYGAEAVEGENFQLNLFYSNHVSPEFCAALKPGVQVAMVLCSPFSMETYQVKGQVRGTKDIEEDQLAVSRFWRENFLLCLRSIGLSAGSLSQLNCEPSLSLTFQVEQVFAQSPRKGTGEKLS